MKIQMSIGKLNKYFDRLDKGKAEKIKPAHVEKVIGKLETRKSLLLAEYERTVKESKKERLKGKLAFVDEQIDRAAWLLEKITKS